MRVEEDRREARGTEARRRETRRDRKLIPTPSEKTMLV